MKAYSKDLFEISEHFISVCFPSNKEAVKILDEQADGGVNDGEKTGCVCPVRSGHTHQRASQENEGKLVDQELHGIRFSYEIGFLFITLPSGRKLAYVKPRIGTNDFGSDCITYEEEGTTKKWERIEIYSPKVVENLCQSISRDLLYYAMQKLEATGCRIVMHIHDEVVIEAPKAMEIDEVGRMMSIVPLWVEGLMLSAEGYDAEFYMKD